MTDNIDEIYKDARAKILSSLNSGKEIMESQDYIKLTKEDVINSNNTELIEFLADIKLTKSGIILFEVDSIFKIKRKVSFPINKMKEGTYKTDRFHAKRTNAIDELRYKLKKKEKTLDDNLFKGVLSTIGRIEKGQTKTDAIKLASEKFNVTQSSIKKELEELEIQIFHKAQYDNQKVWGNMVYGK